VNTNKRIDNRGKTSLGVVLYEFAYVLREDELLRLGQFNPNMVELFFPERRIELASFLGFEVDVDDVHNE
jgi:hypothetical protein